MPFRIVVDTSARIVRVRYRGDVSPDDRLVFAEQVMDEADRAGMHRLLLDFRDAQSLGGRDEDFRWVAEVCAARFPPHARLAYVVRYEHQLNERLEALIRARGVQVGRFLDVAKAIAWLQAATLAAVDPAPAAAPARTDPVRAYRLAVEAAEPASAVSAVQFAAIADLVQVLLAKGLDEATIQQIAGRMASVMRASRHA